jgi:alanine racemase
MVAMTPPSSARPRAEAVVDLDAITANTAALRAHVEDRDLMAVVKADGYGHGLVESGRAARQGGASWLGVALLSEGLALRAGGDRGPLLAWLAVPGESYDDAIDNDVDVSPYSLDSLAEIVTAARRRGMRARIQLKVDSGLTRGGIHPDDWPALVEETRRQQDAGWVEVTGVWSHLACADEPDHPSIATQVAVFTQAVDDAERAGVEVPATHLASSGAVLTRPDTWFSMVRPGIALYGISPLADAASPVPLRAAMRLEATVALTKRVPAGTGISYGHTYTTATETTVALVPLGYGDGIPRHASNRAPVRLGDQCFTVAGRISMDQFVLDVGDAPARAGDPVVVFGGDPGDPTANDWARACDTIGYEIVSRIGVRVPRRYVGLEHLTATGWDL